MMSSVYRYNGALDAVKALLAREGPAGLLKGYWVTNSVWIPWNVLYISGYEVGREAVARWTVGEHTWRSGCVRECCSLRHGTGGGAGVQAASGGWSIWWLPS
jgi:hypothetical protein